MGAIRKQYDKEPSITATREVIIRQIKSKKHTTMHTGEDIKMQSDITNTDHIHPIGITQDRYAVLSLLHLIHGSFPHQSSSIPIRTGIVQYNLESTSDSALISE